MLVFLGKFLRYLGDFSLDDGALEINGLRVNFCPELPGLGDDLVVVVEGRHPVLLHPVAVAQCLGEEGRTTEPGDHGHVRRLLILGNIIKRLNPGHVCVNLVMRRKS